MQTVIAMPFVLDGGRGETVIEAQGVLHRVNFEIDPIRREPRIDHKTAPSDLKIGSRIALRWPHRASHLLRRAEASFLQLVSRYGWFNPHAELSSTWDGVVAYQASATDPSWPKWGPADPISAYWFVPGQLENLIAAQVARDQDLGQSRSVREFVATFRGLSGTAKQREVLGETGLARQPLAGIFADGSVDRAAIGELFDAMRRHSRPVKPADLGIVGADHFKRYLHGASCTADSLRYHKVLGLAGNLPFVVEAAFGSQAPGSRGERGLITGVNWSPALRNPFRFVVEGGQSSASKICWPNNASDGPMDLGPSSPFTSPSRRRPTSTAVSLRSHFRENVQQPSLMSCGALPGSGVRLARPRNAMHGAHGVLRSSWQKATRRLPASKRSARGAPPLALASSTKRLPRRRYNQACQSAR